MGFNSVFKGFITVFTRGRHLSLSCQINPVHALPTDFFKTHFNITFPTTSSSSKWYLSLRFHHWNLFMHLSSPTHMPRAICPAHVSLLHMIARIMSVVEFLSRSSSSCNFLQSPVTRSLLAQIASSERILAYQVQYLQTRIKILKRGGSEPIG